MKKISLDNALKYYKKNLTEDQKEEQRRIWKTQREKDKEQNMPTTLERNESNADLQNIQRCIEYKFRKENLKLQTDLAIMMKKFKRLEKQLFRHQEKLKEMNENYENVMIRLKILENSTKLDETE